MRVTFPFYVVRLNVVAILMSGEECKLGSFFFHPITSCTKVVSLVQCSQAPSIRFLLAGHKAGFCSQTEIGVNLFSHNLIFMFIDGRQNALN
jgi:hypothetical protein